MDDQEDEQEALEHILNDSSANPIMLSYAFLNTITNKFSEVIGGGGFGVVYMGTLRNGKVALKQLSRTDDFSEKQFEDELLCLIRVKHKNIVRCLGYCSDTSRQVVRYNGKYVLADIRRRFLCFEYAPNKSLHDYLKDSRHSWEWNTRYQLIEGICQGLHYLHNEERINHLDLKPENILLDAEMVPKITDFGLSRRFSGAQSRIITEHILGTPGYMAPEYWSKGEISFKADIFSLGIIIKKLLRGSNDLSDFENWHKSLHIHFPHVKKYIEIAKLCVEDDQHKRPTIDYIIGMLYGKETMIEKFSTIFGHSANESWSSEEHVNSESMRMFGIDPRKVQAASEPLKDASIKDESSATSNLCSPVMPIRQSGQVTTQCHGAEYNLNLYMHQTIDGPNHNQVNIVDPKQPMMFGYTNAHDYPIYDSLSPNAKIVARAQGLHTKTCMNYDDWFHWSSIVFSDERFRGSSFKAIGNQDKVKGEWAIIGGTGVFTFAQGTISISRIQHNGSSNIKDICISAFCCTPSTPTESKPFMDGWKKDESNATSSLAKSSVAIPQNGPVAPQCQGAEYNLNLYMHQTIDGPNHNQINIADPKQPMMFGYTNVHDYPIYDSLGPSAKIVARAQGLHAETSMNSDDWFHWSSIVFSDERFQGSSFKAIGNQNKLEGEWAIVGGTGMFTFAHGTISISRIQHNGSSNIKYICIRAWRCIPHNNPEIKDNCNAAHNLGSPSMANPKSNPTTLESEGTEYNLNLYMHQTIDGPDHNQVNIADPKQRQMFGYTNVHDYPIYDSLGSSAKIVARAQGLHTETSMNYDDWFHWSSIVFSDERFRGSSLKAIGNQNKLQGEWPIVGGTGVFTFARGTISISRIQHNGSSNIKDIRIRALCCTPCITSN
ncbi:hypothetical protein ACP70R_004004 [Stipagrostis hirtigluma subsp. patula]